MKGMLLVLCVLPTEISSIENDVRKNPIGVTIKAKTSLSWDSDNVRIAYSIEVLRERHVIVGLIDENCLIIMNV